MKGKEAHFCFTLTSIKSVQTMEERLVSTVWAPSLKEAVDALVGQTGLIVMAGRPMDKEEIKEFEKDKKAGRFDKKLSEVAMDGSDKPFIGELQ